MIISVCFIAVQIDIARKFSQIHIKALFGLDLDAYRVCQEKRNDVKLEPNYSNLRSSKTHHCFHPLPSSTPWSVGLSFQSFQAIPLVTCSKTVMMVSNTRSLTAIHLNCFSKLHINLLFRNKMSSNWIFFMVLMKKPMRF